MSFIVSLFKPLAYISLPVLFLRSLSNSSPVARYYIRAVAYAGTLVSVASGCIFAAIGYSLAGKKYDVNNFVAKVFYGAVSRLFNLQVEVEGEQYLDMRPAVIMVNHQSMLDILIVGRCMPKQTTIVSKESLKFSPLGPFMAMSGTVFLNRGNNVKAVKSLNDAGNLIKKDKISTWIFPEGTRHLSPESDMLPLKKGGFHLAVTAGIPIIPIVVENYHHLYHHGVFNEGVIKVKVLPPIPTVGLTSADIGQLAISVREQMVETLHEISSHATPPSAKKEPTPVPQPQVAFSEKPPASPTPSSQSSALGVSASTTSLASSTSTVSTRRSSENGAETEEDEGMILVGRPESQ
ncbi:1-acylglycerol-3-phosphate O-acyltransferase [Ephemerocybe angulata]|uniref:1-acyl-sn-glycerol-3-phosphate acyltransferase n=1 Tax=Ephemerocybe angulata TaxID=980116 RepID=A0A8H6MEF5_9AGAR|nr:1-acylglycerol-3-phosphate O-acyltransferase [Tulosesus angulatus]